MKKLIIIGGKGNGTLVLSTVQDINRVNPTWQVLGFLNDREIELIENYPVLGKVDYETVHTFLKDPEIYFYYALISVKLNFKFLTKLESLNIPLERFATIIHPSAIIADNVKIGYGTCILPQVCISAFSEIGNFVQILPQVFLGTGARMSDYCYAAPKAYVGAYVNMEEGAYLGPSCSVIEFINLGKWSLVGMGSVVIKPVPEFTKVVGNPAHIIGEVK